MVSCRASAKSSPATQLPDATPPDAQAIRGVDFGQEPALQTLLRQTGGTYDPHAFVYADVTGDGREEAIVPISSGGTLGNVAYQVYTLKGLIPSAILTSTRDQTTAGGLIMSVLDGKLMRTVAKYGPEDPRCCPSALVRTYYRWDGVKLQVEREEEVQAAAPKGKE